MPAPNSDGSRDTEIHYDDAAVLVDHDVLRLQVAMDYPFGVRGVQRGANLINDVSALREAQFLPSQRAQILALDELHGDELDVVHFTKVKNADDVSVGDLAREDQFLFEAPQYFFVQRKFGTNHFQRHKAIQREVPRFIYRAHSAFAQQLHDFESRTQASAIGQAAAVKHLCAGPRNRLRPALRRRTSRLHCPAWNPRLKCLHRQERALKKSGVVGRKRRKTSGALRSRWRIAGVTVGALSGVRRHSSLAMPLVMLC